MSPTPFPTNPWLSVPASDYEGHMSSPAVGQLQFLNRVFASLLQELKPASVAVLGCTTGNGFEHIDPAITRRVIGIDINPEYLEILRGRYQSRIPELSLISSDIVACELEPRSVDLVYCALLLEHVEPRIVVEKVARWLAPRGILSVVLQLPSDNSSKVIDTPFSSVKILESTMQLVPPDLLKSIARDHHLQEVRSRMEVLETGRAFVIVLYARADA